MNRYGDERYRLDQKTIVHDMESGTRIGVIEGVVVLPVGSVVELTNPNINVTVERVRLLAAGGPGCPVTVCLDVRVPKA